MSQYASDLSIPDGFPQILKDFSREILRNFPGKDCTGADALQWLHEFGATYFAGAAQSSAAPDALDLLSAEEVEKRVRAMFEDADADHSGALDFHEFRAVIDTFCSELELDANEIRMILAQADTSGDGLIQYEEFVGVGVQIIAYLLAQRRAHGRGAPVQQTVLVHGLTPEHLQAVMADLFNFMDEEHTGKIPLRELPAGLRGAGLGVTQQQINALMLEAEPDAEGQVAWADFVPTAAEIIQAVMQLQLQRADLSKASIGSALSQAFHDSDVEQHGKLSLPRLADAVRSLDLGLPELQIHAIVGDAPLDQLGLVDYTAFTEAAAASVLDCLRVAVDADAATRVVEWRESGTAAVYGQNGPEAWVEQVSAAVLEAGAPGSEQAPAAAVMDALASAGLSAGDAQAVVAYAANSAGVDISNVTTPVPLGVVIDCAPDVVLARAERALLSQ